MHCLRGYVASCFLGTIDCIVFCDLFTHNIAYTYTMACVNMNITAHTLHLNNNNIRFGFLVVFIILFWKVFFFTIGANTMRYTHMKPNSTELETIYYAFSLFCYVAVSVHATNVSALTPSIRMKLLYVLDHKIGCFHNTWKMISRYHVSIFYLIHTIPKMVSHQNYYIISNIFYGRINIQIWMATWTVSRFSLTCFLWRNLFAVNRHCNYPYKFFICSVHFTIII